MNPTDQTLLEQMRITDFEVDYRKALLSFDAEDVQRLLSIRPSIEARLDELVNRFYQAQTQEPEIALLIGDAGTLARLRSAQRQYIMELFSGVYDLGYVNNRLRIGLVHKRIGVEPKLYLSAVHTLKTLLIEVIDAALPEREACKQVIASLHKLLYFDVTLVFETYIRSMVSEIETARKKSDTYARSMEEKVKERTQQLEALSRTDPLTGLENQRHLRETLIHMLRSAQRRSEPVTVAYIDLNDFKAINDTYGHQHGDEALRAMAEALRSNSRHEDVCYRIGGDEFCVLLPNSRSEDIRHSFIERTQQALARSRSDLTFSVGLAHTGPTDYVDADTLIRQADERMYEDKRARKARQLPRTPALAAAVPEGAPTLPGAAPAGP
ncbi:MAG: GGDEF domain-containing protein [Burkholderiaceae bacterium]|nr:GGDEF domain-containing protein [Burkholderiaceae bacterium]